MNAATAAVCSSKSPLTSTMQSNAKNDVRMTCTDGKVGQSKLAILFLLFLFLLMVGQSL